MVSEVLFIKQVLRFDTTVTIIGFFFQERKKEEKIKKQNEAKMEREKLRLEKEKKKQEEKERKEEERRKKEQVIKILICFDHRVVICGISNI